MYTIRNHCEEIPELEYGDGLHFYYFYTGGKHGGNEQIRTLLRYIQDSREENATDEATKELHSYVKQAKVSPEVKQAYMRFEEIIYYEREEAALDTQRRNILDFLDDYGKIPENLRMRLQKTDDPELLKRWLRLAAKADSLEDFIKRM